MIDLSGESLISFAQVPRTLPPGRGGRPVTPSCPLRWVLSGVQTPAGRVYLEAVRLGGRWLTSREALQRFAERLTPRMGGAEPSAPRGPDRRRRASERAGAELETLGL